MSERSCARRRRSARSDRHQDRHSPHEGGALAKAASGALDACRWCASSIWPARSRKSPKPFLADRAGRRCRTDIKAALGPRGWRWCSAPRVRECDPTPARIAMRWPSSRSQTRWEPQRLQRRGGRAYAASVADGLTTGFAQPYPGRAGRRRTGLRPRHPTTAAEPRLTLPGSKPCSAPSSASRSSSLRRARCGPSNGPLRDRSTSKR